MKKQLNLDDLKIESFVTSEESFDSNTVRGGWGFPSNDCTGNTDCVCATETIYCRPDDF